MQRNYLKTEGTHENYIWIRGLLVQLPWNSNTLLRHYR